MDPAATEPGESWPGVPAGLRAHVEAVVASVIDADELDGVVVGWATGAPYGEPPVDTAVEDDQTMLWAWVTARGETFRCPLWEPHSATVGAGVGAFAEQLEDFVAESRFGWGQLRRVPARLRRLP